MSKLPLIVAILSPLLVGACQPAVYSVTQDRAYSPSRFHFAAGAKDLYTVIRGNPFEWSDGRVEALVLSAMQRGVWHIDTALVRRPTFTTRPGPAAHPDYRITLVLNPQEGVDAAALCAEPEAVAIRPGGNDLRARMVFCRGAQVLSTSFGTVAAVDDPADPGFARMIAYMTRELFPHRKFRDGFGDSGSLATN